MNSVTTTLTLETTDGPVRAEVSAWDDGSILVLVGGVAVKVDDVGVVAAAVRWAALDRVECKIVTEVPAQEVTDRATAAVEQARLHAEGEAARVAEGEAVAAEAAAAVKAREAEWARQAVEAARRYRTERDAWIAENPGSTEADYDAYLDDEWSE